MGAAILAGIGAGVFPDFSVIDRFVRIEQTVQPIPENVKKYERGCLFSIRLITLCVRCTQR